MKNTFLLLLLIATLSCAQDKRPILGETDFQRKINTEYKDASKSPLKNKDRKIFTTLDFFKFDSTYVVTATIKKTPNTDWFDMKTTTSRVSPERIFGILSFELKGKQHQLNVYQGKDAMKKEGLEDYLFLPFLDETNSFETYGGGRYIDLKIPKGNTIIIDFNTAYNPYCAYNDKFSCPIVPRINYLKTKIEVGVKAFDKH